MPARQTSLALPTRSPDRGRSWGGARRGAGRKPTGAHPQHIHAARPYLSRRHPVHVVVRVSSAVGRLRRRRAYQAFRRALLTSLARSDFRVVHISIQGSHVHLLCEADHRLALANGVRGFSISAAHRLNAAISIDRKLARRRRGRVFVDRYHATQLSTPTHARHALAYVLNNWRKHREPTAAPGAHAAAVDRYSSAVAFPGWADRAGRPFLWPRAYEPLPVAFPVTWLLTVGWRRAGPLIATTAIPSARRDY
jgi:REP element-mobilizing transposase RayT